MDSRESRQTASCFLKLFALPHSNAVFSNQGNPFPETGQTKGHYHPSRASPLTPEQKQTVLSPARLHPRGASHARLSDDPLSPPDIHFLKGSQRLVVEPHNSASSSSPFDESWPSTELSTSQSPEGATREPMPGWTNEGWLSPSYPTQDVSGLFEDADGTPKDGSVIAKYMERFRHGRPSSREERSAPVPIEEKPFWWLHSSPTKSSSPGDDLSAGRRSHFEYDVSKMIGKSMRNSAQNTSRLGGESLSRKGAGTSQLCTPDQETLRLQARAARLLQRSESSLSSTPPVSSEGLGSSPLSGTSQSDEDAIRKPLLRSVADFSTGPVGSLQLPISVTPYQPLQVLPPCRPEEDILFQWRLRRKMEQARDGILPVSTRKKSLSPPVRLSKQGADGHDVKVVERALQTGPRGDTRWDNAAVASPVPHAKRLASGDFISSQPVPPHLHHFCDLLPCPHQASHPLESRTGKRRMHRGQPITDSRLEHSQQAGSPDEASSEELCESSMDVTPLEHTPVEQGREIRTTRNQDPQDTSSTWLPGKARRVYSSSERPTSMPTAHRTSQRDQESFSRRQESEVQWTKKESEKRSSKPTAAWREKPQDDPLEGTLHSRRRSERIGPLQDSTSQRKNSDHRVTERELVPGEETREREISHHKSTKRERGPGGGSSTQKITHQNGSENQCVLEADTRTQETAHKRTTERAKMTKEKYFSRTSKDRGALEDETGAHHPGSVKHGLIDTGVRRGHGQPARSPIRSVLGQVMSERLFSPPTSPHPTGDKSKQQPFISSDEPRPSTSATVEQPRMQPLEVATQLLDDAEDSDGTEFEDDPLLQVLRERRNGILQRLRDVDAFITKLESHESSEPPEPD
ncbi:proline and serine-rich protein 3 isoform X1 [Pleurodeles waltl]|uniref:proline and serine-rich protein 3 isoform X1 n=1 Tax=Pleurodeles waltl TaxID=8319 RepID=UPI0037093BD8